MLRSIVSPVAHTQVAARRSQRRGQGFPSAIRGSDCPVRVRYCGGHLGRL